MDRSDLRHNWVDPLDTRIWDESVCALDPWERDFCARLKNASLRLGDVLEELSDESLALAVKKDLLRKETFEELCVKRYTSYLLRWFHRWGVPVGSVRELIQQLFCQLLEKHLSTFQPERNFRVYLYQAAWHLWIDHLRRSNKIRSLDGIPEPLSGDTSPEEQIIGLELLQRFDAALARLPAGHREVLRRTMDGQSAEAIGLALDIPKKRVFMLLFRARRRMEKELGLPRSRNRESQSVP